MPELPEVETIKTDLEKALINVKITDLKIYLPKIIKTNLTTFKKTLKNNYFKKIKRRGKLIIISLKEKDKFLLIHLKMTGQLIYQKKEKIIAGGHNEENFELLFPGKHTHLFFTFADNSKLYFNDLRQFGYLKLVNQQELDLILSSYGLEPLAPDFNLKKLKSLLKNKKRNIKAFLLDQKIIAGIGNIYADEILFASKILPLRSTDTLQEEEVLRLFKNIKLILKKAVQYRGTTFNNFVDANGQKGNFLKKLKIYQKEKEPCLKCGSKIQKEKIAGRGTRFCPLCQR